MKKFSTLLMFGCLMVMACVAFAAGDPTQPLYGWYAEAIGAILGFASPYITALFTKLHWQKWQKLLTLYIVSLVLSLAGGIFTGAITSAGIKSEGIIEVIVTLLAVGKVTYDWLNGSVKAVAAATDGKKN